jgi:predicted N-acyltransferase
VFEFDVEIIQRISEIEPEKWDYVARNYPLASYRWYEFGETVLADAVPLYILLSRHSEPLARATFWLLRHEPLPVPIKLVRSAMATAFRRWPLLMCRTPLTDISGLILPQDPALRDAALTTIAQIAREWGRQQGVSFIVFDYLHAGEFTLQVFPCIEMAGPSTCLVNRWNNFDDYLKQLGSSARKDFNRHRNRAADLRLVVQAQNNVSNID